MTFVQTRKRMVRVQLRCRLKAVTAVVEVLTLVAFIVGSPNDLTAARTIEKAVYKGTGY